MSPALRVAKDMQNWMSNKSNPPLYPEVLQTLFPEILNVTTTKRVKRQQTAGHHSPDEDDGDQFDFSNYHNANDLQNDDVDTPMPALPTSESSVLSPSVPFHSLSVPNNVAVASPIVPKSSSKSKTKVTTQQHANTNKSSTKRKRNKTPVANPKPQPSVPTIVDIRPLVEEIRAGRYPSMKEFDGNHLNICFVCKNKGGDDLYYCEFCENAEHLSCVQSKVTIREIEEDDEFMCHRCIQYVVARRVRAEKRRLRKLDEAMGRSSGATGDECDSNSNGASAKAIQDMTSIKKEITWNQSDFDNHIASYQKCPSGGPGGLICCSHCTAAYSRLLSETSKEMDSQTVSSVGREVSELMQLLKDAQDRLKQVVDSSVGNDVRMSMLNKDQVIRISSNNNHRHCEYEAATSDQNLIMDFYR